MHVIDAAQHTRNIGIFQTAPTKCNRLIEQTETITHTAIGCPGNSHDRAFIRFYGFRL